MSNWTFIEWSIEEWIPVIREIDQSVFRDLETLCEWEGRRRNQRKRSNYWEIQMLQWIDQPITKGRVELSEEKESLRSIIYL